MDEIPDEISDEIPDEILDEIPDKDVPPAGSEILWRTNHFQ
ncbi:MAG: hypothetical protein WBF05_09520 [Anaerolineales bacterium]